MLPSTRFQPAAIYPPAQPQVSSREWPTLTIYRDGMANLNGLATELLRQADTVALVAPPPTKPGRLTKAWQLHGNPEAEGTALFGRCDRGLLRFRSAAAARALFAAVPGSRPSLSFVLTPEPGRIDRFRLLPL